MKKSILTTALLLTAFGLSAQMVEPTTETPTAAPKPAIIKSASPETKSSTSSVAPIKPTVNMSGTAPAKTAPAPTATAPAPTPGGGKLNFNVESYDFGKITEGTKATYDFVFTNTGTETIVLTNVKASCGCTTPSWPKEPIPVGGTAKITATYNSQGRIGPFNKAITITSNASEVSKQLFIKGVVEKAPTETPAPEKAPSLMSTPKN